MLDNFKNLIDAFAGILSGGVATSLMTIAFIAFMLAIINYIWKRRNGDAGGLEQAGTMLFGSVFGLFVMVTVWGIVNFLATNLLGSDANKTTIQKPQTVFSGSQQNSSAINSGTRAACNTFNNSLCPVSYCKVDSYDGCVNK